MNILVTLNFKELKFATPTLFRRVIYYMAIFYKKQNSVSALRKEIFQNIILSY
jgi:hypothetical protein